MALQAIAPGVWTEDRVLNLVGGLVLPIRMTVLSSGDGGLIVKDKAAHRGSLDALAESPLEHIIMAHGEVFSAADAGSAVRSAMLRW